MHIITSKPLDKIDGEIGNALRFINNLQQKINCQQVKTLILIHLWKRKLLNGLEKQVSTWKIRKI